MKLLFFGDLNFRGMDGLTEAASAEILSKVMPYAHAADYRIVNLETPLADQTRHTPIYKSGSNLICDPKNIVFLKALGVDAVTLANNHIGDYGEGAVFETLSHLDSSNILWCGAGADVMQAYDACRLEKDGVTVSIISVCENEFGMATETTAGSAGYHAGRLLRKIREEKQRSDTVIVVFHGGNEFNPLPSPDTQDRYRLICDMGADAVIAGHTHCPQGYEFYDGKPIVYSMGNFLFRSSSERSAENSWYYGYMAQLDLTDSGIGLEVIPYRFSPCGTNIHVFSDDEKQIMLAYISTLSDILSDRDTLDAYFGGWAYLHRWISQAPANYDDLPDYFSAGNYNLICCESHYSQAKKILHLCVQNKIKEAEAWAEKIQALAKMPL
jgi:poly-gamma-glutamate synthesis protein (capsule biosynthesis protein)